MSEQSETQIIKTQRACNSPTCFFSPPNPHLFEESRVGHIHPGPWGFAQATPTSPKKSPWGLRKRFSWWNCCNTLIHQQHNFLGVANLPWLLHTRRSQWPSHISVSHGYAVLNSPGRSALQSRGLHLTWLNPKHVMFDSF